MKTAPRLTSPRNSHSLLHFGDQLYVIGGGDGLKL